jgi:hypothetical protein
MSVKDTFQEKTKLSRQSAHDLKVVETFFNGVLQKANDSISNFGEQYLKGRLSGTTFIADIDGTLSQPNKGFGQKENLDNFLVDIYKRDFPVILVSDNPDQDLESKIYKAKLKEDNIEHPIMFKKQFSDVGLVMIDYNYEDSKSKALSVAHVSSMESFLESWTNLSEKDKNNVLQPIKNFEDDAENFWVQMNKPFQNNIGEEGCGNTKHSDWVFSKDPDYPFYNFARKIKPPEVKPSEMSFVQMVVAESETDNSQDTFTEKIIEEQDASKSGGVSITDI